MANEKSEAAKANKGNGRGPNKDTESTETSGETEGLTLQSSNGSGQNTSNRVAQTNNAAKDDVFTAENAEWLAEAGGLTGSLDVLANDPGSAHIVAVHGELPGATGPVAPNAGTSFTVEQDGNEYEIALSINEDGTIAVDASSLGGLTDGETAEVSFYYTAQMGKNGAMSTAMVTIEVTGEDSPAEISGDAEGTVQEDGTLLAEGTLSVEDPDAGQEGFEEIANPDDLVGTFGDFTFDAETGEWTYELRNDDENVQALNTGDSETDTLTVASLDGTSQDIVVTVEGEDELEEPQDAEPVDGFEEGLSGFLTIGSVGAVETSDAGGSSVDPTEGAQMAGLSTEDDFGGDAASAEEIETFLGLTLGTLTGLGNGDAVEGAALQTTLTLAEGETLTFDYRFDTQEDTSANDFAFLSLSTEGTSELADVELVGDAGDSDWQTYSFTAADAGEYDLGLGVVDSGDDFGLSLLFIDNLAIV